MPEAAIDIALPRFTCLAEMIEAQGERHGGKAALRFRARETSYADLARGSRAVAGALRASGCRAGDRIAYLGKNSDVFYELLLGAARAGLTLVPVNWLHSFPTRHSSDLKDRKSVV